MPMRTHTPPAAAGRSAGAISCSAGCCSPNTGAETAARAAASPAMPPMATTPAAMRPRRRADDAPLAERTTTRWGHHPRRVLSRPEDASQLRQVLAGASRCSSSAGISAQVMSPCAEVPTCRRGRREGLLAGPRTRPPGRPRQPAGLALRGEPHTAEGKPPQTESPPQTSFVTMKRAGNRTAHNVNDTNKRKGTGR
jgi:hypothetical protein